MAARLTGDTLARAVPISIKQYCVCLQSGRLCLAVPSSEAQPKGIVLGGSSSAGVLYVEPQAAVPLNNDLAAARGEAYAAVENVLWKLTGLIADTIEDVQQALDTVRHSL